VQYLVLELAMQNINFGDISLTTFLQDYWQQKPLLIREAIPHYSCPISANEMAGLACEPDLESRIILEKEGLWECRQGPFDEEGFSTLPETHWTLLLQSCNLYIPEFAQLLERFRFIPNWRVDDIMVSYAAPGGSVGPHTDNYDVFLLQAHGRRRWSISTHPTVDEDFITDLDVKILKSFEAQHSWDLDPGDMLYLPPGVAHHGVALQGFTNPVEDNGQLVDSDDCITISIGFRAPDVTELSTALLDEVLAQASLRSNEDFNATAFYTDPEMSMQENSGEINAWTLQRIKQLLQQELNKKINSSDWFGKYITHVDESSDVFEEKSRVEISPEQCMQQLQAGQELMRNEYSKLAFITISKDDPGEHDATDKVRFFCNGNVRYYSSDFLDIISLVCNHRYPSSTELIRMLNNRDTQLFLCELVNQRHFCFSQKDDE